MDQANELLNPKEMPTHFVFEFIGVDRPLILPASSIGDANKRIQKAYSIKNLSNLSE
jgi:hypothetical protein